MRHDIQNILRLFLLAIAILIMKTASGISGTPDHNLPLNTEGGVQMTVSSDTVSLSYKAVY